MFHVEHFVADSEITRRTTHASCHTGQKPCSTGQTRASAPTWTSPTSRARAPAPP